MVSRSRAARCSMLQWRGPSRVPRGVNGPTGAFAYVVGYFNVVHPPRTTSASESLAWQALILMQNMSLSAPLILRGFLQVQKSSSFLFEGVTGTEGPLCGTGTCRALHCPDTPSLHPCRRRLRRPAAGDDEGTRRAPPAAPETCAGKPAPSGSSQSPSLHGGHRAFLQTVCDDGANSSESIQEVGEASGLQGPIRPQKIIPAFRTAALFLARGAGSPFMACLLSALFFHVTFLSHAQRTPTWLVQPPHRPPYQCVDCE